MTKSIFDVLNSTTTMYRFHITLILACLSAFSFSQTLTSSSTESRCLNSGTIAVSISGGTASYSYSLTGGPNGPSAPSYPTTTTTSATTDTFKSLIPGEYFIEVLDQNGTYYDTVTVAGSYSEPRFDLNARNIRCGGASDGMLWASNLADGRAPFQFQIVSPLSQVTGLQSNDTFSNLPSGTYDVRMYDSCGNFQTRTATIADNYTNVDIISSNSDGRISCDSATLFVRPRYGTTPYTIRVVDPTNSSNFIDSAVVTTESFTYTGFDLPIYYPAMSTSFTTNYRFEVTDSCGNTDFTFNRHNVYNNETTTGHCDGFGFSYGSSQFQNAVWGDSVWFEMSPDILSLGRVGFANTGSRVINFDTIPFGNYTYTITTICDTLTGSFGETKLAFDSIYVLEIPESCTEGLARIRVEPFGRPDGIYHTTVYKGSTLIDSSRHTETGRLIYNIDSGEYTITMWDECEDTVVRTLLIDTSVIVTLTTETSPFCGGGGNIKARASISGSSASFKYFRLFNELGVEITSERISTSADSAQWTNLTAGTYIVGVNYNSYSQSFCIPKTDTVILEGYQFPTIQAVQVACTGGDYAIQGRNVTGTGPFTYYLRDQATLTIQRGPQTTDTFTNLIGAGPYNILVVDSCGNTANASANPYTPNVNLSIVNGIDCENQFLEAAIDTTLETIYTWTGPNSFTSSAKSISFNPVTDNDTGSYNLNANMLNGCLVILDTFKLEANSVTQASAASPTTSCFGSAPIYDSVVSVINANSLVGTEVGYWQIIGSPTNGDWNMIDSTNPSLRVLTDSVGDYLCVWNIESDKGCISADTATITSVCPAAAIPVELISFTASRSKNGVLLNWDVASQINNRGFNLFRSTDGGTSYSYVTFIGGDGTTSNLQQFQYFDKNAPNLDLTYKLTQEDFDGSYSDFFVFLHANKSPNSISIYPNPAQSQFTINISDSKYETLKITDINGSELYNSSILGLESITINNNNVELDNGVYFLQFSSRNLNVCRKVIISK